MDSVQEFLNLFCNPILESLDPVGVHELFSGQPDRVVAHQVFGKVGDVVELLE